MGVNIPQLHPKNRDFVWRDPAPAHLARLTPEQFAAFNTDGFAVLKDVFSEAEIESVIAAIDPLEEEFERYVREEEDGQYRLTSAGTITFTVHLVKPKPEGDDELIGTACRELSVRFRIDHATIQFERSVCSR